MKRKAAALALTVAMTMAVSGSVYLLGVALGNPCQFEQRHHCRHIHRRNLLVQVDPPELRDPPKAIFGASVILFPVSADRLSGRFQ